MNQIQTIFNQIQTKKMLVIFPHPDDESVMAAGLMQQAIAKGIEVEVISLTAGEAGQIHCNGNGKSLKLMRIEEFSEAMSVLGVTRFGILDLPDGKLRESDRLENVLSKIKWEKYGMVVSYDHSGISGHPDHISASLEIKTQISKVTGDKRPLLLWVSMQGRAKEHMVHKGVANYVIEPEYEVRLGVKERLRKWRAIRAHRSQALGNHFPLPLLFLVMMFGSEYFSVARIERDYEYEYVEFEI